MPISKVSVTTTAAELLPAGSRLWWCLENPTDTDIVIAFEGVEAPNVTLAAGSKPGITLKASGGKLFGGKSGEFGKQVDNAIWGLHGGSGTKSLTIHYSNV